MRDALITATLATAVVTFVIGGDVLLMKGTEVPTPHLLPTILMALFAVAPALLTELLTKWHASATVKRWTNVILSVGAATAAQFAIEDQWSWSQAIVKFGIAWGTSVALHHAGGTNWLQKLTPNVGIGGNGVGGPIEDVDAGPEFDPSGPLDDDTDVDADEQALQGHWSDDPEATK